MPDLMEKVVSLCKRRGFVFPGSEIYGGLASTWDFGPLGVEFKNNLKGNWWQTFVQNREDIYGIDGGILINPTVWKASGHVESFVDPLVECKKCHKRFRADQLETKKCPECGGEFTKPQMFNALFKTFIGPAEDSSSVAYLRPETAQNIFLNFKNILNTFQPRLPFGIAQIGKSFRNEITAGYYIFRTLEFEQMEIEYFICEKGWEEVFEDWQKKMFDWAVSVGIKKENLKWREHAKKELSHYSKRTCDLEYKFPIGFRELYGLAYRFDFDLKNHAKHSGKDLKYRDPDSGEEFLPYVVEPSFGVERTLLPVLLDAYREEKDEKGQVRVVLGLNPVLAPYKAAVFPLVANKPKLVKKARGIFDQLQPQFMTAWDDIGNIGKRYRRQDEIGTPWCVTVDYQTLKDDTVTVRDRDSMKQGRVVVGELADYIDENLLAISSKKYLESIKEARRNYKEGRVFSHGKAFS